MAPVLFSKALKLDTRRRPAMRLRERGDVAGRPGIEMKRRGEAHEVAALIVFLCSQQATFMTGADYRVDGGSVATT